VAATLIESAAADVRIERAAQWLAARAPGEEVVVVGATADAANELLRGAAQRAGAAFGWHRVTLPRLASILATAELVERGLAPIGGMACEAVAARALHRQEEKKGLGRYARAAHGPGLARAIARTIAELRHAGVAMAAIERVAPDLFAVAAAFEKELRDAGLADRAAVLRLAEKAARRRKHPHPLLGKPALLLDVAVTNEAERALIAAVAGRASAVLATVPAGDDQSRTNLASALGCDPIVIESDLPASALRSMQAHLFRDSTPKAGGGDESVVVFSAPGESRECVEIARRVMQCGAAGIGFDRIAVLLRSPEEYRPHLEEALERAAIPAHFARGAVRPHTAGRAFLSLLACAAEGLSANRFAEYLSLAVVPDADSEGSPPAPADERWVAPDEEMVAQSVAAHLDDRSEDGGDEEIQNADPENSPVRAGTLRAPRRWEKLIVEAAVIGGRQRWERRLKGLEQELRLDIEALDDNDDGQAKRLQRDLDDLGSLRSYALPLLDVLAALPSTATWGAWLDSLAALATIALRHPDRVLAALGELAPMADVGPVGLDEVRLVLEPRLLEVAVPPSDSRYGRVFIGPIEAARGLCFDAVFVPGLAERLFPRKIAEDSILLDEPRRSLDAMLPTNTQRVAAERLALRLAAGAARRMLTLSYPRLDLDQARPRVPSFYSLESLRAAEGHLPGFDELAERAEIVGSARVGWPAPANPNQAIDEAEHDLALLERLLALDPKRATGTARYLLTANPHLGRALRFRARRWLRRWTPADGLVEPSEAARAALQKHLLSARSYSPTALEKYAGCPYRFLLYAVHKLAPREVPEAIEELSPLQKGSLVHELQFQLFEKLRAKGMLPVDATRLDRARDLLDETLDQLAAEAHEELAPAIERVWQDGIESIRADLREWLRRASAETSGFVPWRFELSFGLRGRRSSDESSVPDALPLDCGIQLRGSIDLVERRNDGTLRATDHKTGKARVSPGAMVAGGATLQPLLYALALERLFPDVRIDSGRLYYCTTAGGFEERPVALDKPSRRAVDAVARTIGDALENAFLPAAPDKGACRWCDFRVVCGPYEELRVRRKPAKELDALRLMRGLP
jgi:ATP-dependent helicase/nuclease subunit B